MQCYIGFLIRQNKSFSFVEIYIVKFDIYMAFCMVQNPCKTRYFHMCKIVQNILFSKPFSNMQNLNKIKYFTPGKMHRKTYSITSLILHPGKITWPQECLVHA